VRVIAKSTLRLFWAKHRDCEQQLKAWYKEAEDAKWQSPKDIKRDYPTASFLQDNRVVFNIKGNHYRLIIKVNYDFGFVWIRFIGAHKEYDMINANKI
jgi:mRNA interferase HigB